jgi:hypothetical protein
VGNNVAYIFHSGGETQYFIQTFFLTAVVSVPAMDIPPRFRKISLNGLVPRIDFLVSLDKLLDYQPVGSIEHL